MAEQSWMNELSTLALWMSIERAKASYVV